MIPPSVHVQVSGPQSRMRRSEEPSEKPLILLVDDEQMMQELGRDLLESHGFRVLVACDGIEAVELYQHHGSDIALVILDLLMPRLDGGQTFLELKKMNRHVRAFFCTGYTPQAVIGSLLEGESLRAIQKPFRPDEFINTVREMLHTTP